MANAERAAAEAVVATVVEAAPLIGIAPPGRRASPSIPSLPSSSPFSDSDKKIHNGWGGDDGNAELKVEEAATIDAAAESGGLNDWAAPADTSTGDDWGAPAEEPVPEQSPDAEKPESARRRDRDPEEEDNTLTLDQYLTQQREKETALLPKLETRKANEGTEDAIPDGAVRLEKGEGETYFSGKVASRPILPIPLLTPL